MKCHICPYSRGLKHVGRIWPTRTFCATHVLFGNFQISNIYVAKCLIKRCREIIQSNLNDTQCGFRPGRSSTESHILFSSKIFRNLGACQRHLLMLCCPQESIRLGSSWKALWSVARIRCCWLPVTGHQVTGHQVTVHQVTVRVRVWRVKSWLFTVSVGVWKGCVLSPLLLIVNISSSQPFQIYSFVGEPH